MSDVGLTQVRPESQMRFHNFKPSGPSGRGGVGGSGAIGNAITDAMAGKGRLPGFPVFLFLSVGFGGLGID